MTNSTYINSKTVLSVVVPVYSGAPYLAELFQRISDLKFSWENDDAPLIIGELIFVNDQSIDNSINIIEPIAENNQWVNILNLSKNFGQHPASIAGILHSSGHWVITMDEDLQHSPCHIAELLLKALRNSLDVVYAAPTIGPHGKITRDLTSSFFKKIMVMLTADSRIAQFNSFRLMRGEIARSAASVCGPDTYFDISLTWFSNAFSTVQIPIQDIRTVEGKTSGYSFGKLLAHARRLILSAQVNLYQTIAMIGILVFFIGTILSAYILFAEYFQPGIFGFRGWPSLITATMIFGSTSTILLAIILEYLSIVVQKSQGKPVFFNIDRKSNTDVIAYLEHKYGNS
jgi:glycosyltransferase involved in cell wall biosynthesis